MRHTLSTLAGLTALLLALPLFAADNAGTEITVTGGKDDAEHVWVVAPLELPKGAEIVPGSTWSVVSGDRVIPCQITPANVLTTPNANGVVLHEVHFLLPSLKANQTETFSLKMQPLAASTRPTGFSRELVGDVTRDTVFAERGQEKRKSLSRFNVPFDDSSKEQRFLTYKPFHHLFDPSTGKVRLTNGPVVEWDAATKKATVTAGELGKYPHHRGIYFGFNKVSYGDKKLADVWHCTGDAHQSFAGDGPESSGPVCDRSLSNIQWHGPGKEVFAREQRQLTLVTPTPGLTCVDFATLVVPAVDGVVKLDGDPQHAGFHFRANALVETKTAKETYFLRPDGQGKPGETRNWDPKSKAGPVSQPWDAMSFVLEGKRYTVLYLNHPENPSESRHSERDYGRIGCYFEYDLTKEKPLKVRYRLCVKEGEFTAEQCAALHKAYTTPAKVSVAKK